MGNCFSQADKDFETEVRKTQYEKKDFRKATKIIIQDIRIRNALAEAGLAEHPIRLCDNSGRGRPDRL